MEKIIYPTNSLSNSTTIELNPTIIKRRFYDIKRYLRKYKFKTGFIDYNHVFTIKISDKMIFRVTEDYKIECTYNSNLVTEQEVDKELLKIIRAIQYYYPNIYHKYETGGEHGIYRKAL